MKRNAGLMAFMLAMGIDPNNITNKRTINKPVSEEEVKAKLKSAQDKRERKKLKYKGKL